MSKQLPDHLIVRAQTIPQYPHIIALIPSHALRESETEHRVRLRPATDVRLILENGAHGNPQTRMSTCVLQLHSV
eukprot:5272024-Amphidinium_carterae.2